MSKRSVKNRGEIRSREIRKNGEKNGEKGKR